MKNKFFLFLFPLFLFSEEILEVPLATQEILIPVHIVKCALHSDRFSESYVNEVSAILSFDFNHSAFSKVVSEKAPITLRPKLTDSGLTVEATNQGEVFELTTPLTGNLSTDRRKIHYLLSKLQKRLFGQEGIFHKRILYANRMKTISEIFVCDFDGKNVKQITQEKGYCISPKFLPKRPGNYLYVSYQLGQAKLYLSDLKLKKGVSIIPLKGNQILPSISQKGDQIAFIGDAGGRPDLFLQSFDDKGNLLGKPRQIFSYPFATQASPTFSPDGAKIAFVSDKDGPPRIYLLDLTRANTAPELLTKQNKQNTSPAWSPDGMKLAYSAKTDGVRQIWIYDFQEKIETQLTFAKENMENPMWASDSLHLVFNSEGDLAELYIANIHQNQFVKISEGIGHKRFPSWEIDEGEIP